MTSNYSMKIVIISLSVALLLLFTGVDAFAQSRAYAVTPSTIDFGPVYTNEMQWERTYVKSYWAYTLMVQTVNITGDEDFSIKPADDSCSGKNFDYDQDCPLKVTFVPTKEGSRQAVLAVLSNGGINLVNLKGVGVISPASTIMATASPTSGTIVPSGDVTIPYGAEQAFRITPNVGLHVHDVTVDGVSQGAVTNYTFREVTANHKISVSFASDVFTITTTAGEGGTISPAGPITAYYRNGRGFTISPDPGYRIADVQVDDVSIGAKSHLFMNVTADHSITAKFTKN